VSGRLTFHPLVQKDLNEILFYYEQEASSDVADRFEAEFRDALAAIKENPRHFPYYLKQRCYRRFALPNLPSPDPFPGDFDLNPRHGSETCQTITRIRVTAAVGDGDGLRF
jgi:hypothetical protein